MRVLEDFEVVSTCGTHLGHQMTDPDGAPRFCINLCSVAGNPRADGATADDAGIDRALKLREAWPVLHEIADAGCWRGAMHYATGPDALSVAPFVLEGTTRVQLTAVGETQDGGGDGASEDDDGNAADVIGKCALTSTAVMPDGVERTVAMVGPLSSEAGSTARLEKDGGGGPIYLLLSEIAGARTVLIREVNATTGEVVVASSLVLAGSDDSLELIQSAHELTQSPAVSPDASEPIDDSSSRKPAVPSNAVSGVQLWRMVPTPGDQDGEDDKPKATLHDLEAFMYSGSEL